MKPVLLIADADAELCDLFLRLFTDHGYRVEVAPDGLDCVEKLRRCRPDVLIVDRDLPWGGADGVLARMQEDPDVPLLPAVLMSTSDFGAAAPLPIPVVACLLKPFRLRALVDAVVNAKTTLRDHFSRN